MTEHNSVEMKLDIKNEVMTIYFSTEEFGISLDSYNAKLLASAIYKLSDELEEHIMEKK
jgi:hypothetical protein